MIKIAIIQFPGLNTEYETRREINRSGMSGEFFRWNDDPKKLEKYDGFVIGGGFSYEDRGRAGVIASLDPIMKAIKTESEKGKPVLGICNGAQILVETGLIPGADGNRLSMALARNKRIKDGQILGTGYYNVWTHLKCAAKCMFTKNIAEGEILYAPIAHGEGRFTTEIADLIQRLLQSGQMVFRYCDRNGVMTEEFPINPNGAMYNLAAVCNPAGNVMAIMPHLERAKIASEKLFSSMRDSIMERRSAGLDKKRARHLAVKPIQTWPLSQFQRQEKSLEFFISLIITDNEAETFEMAINRSGWPKITLRRFTHIELEYKGKPNFEKLAKQLTQSGVLLNTNKEVAKIQTPKQKIASGKVNGEAREGDLGQIQEGVFVKRLLVREKQDFVGLSKLSTIQNRLEIKEITGVKTGTLWEIRIPTKSKNVAEDELKKIIATHIFFNPHSQNAYDYL